MARTQLDGIGGARKIERLVTALLRLAILAQLIDALGGQRLEFVDLHANGLLLVGCHIAEIVHQGCDLTLLAEIFQAELFYFLRILSA